MTTSVSPGVPIVFSGSSTALSRPAPRLGEQTEDVLEMGSNLLDSTIIYVSSDCSEGWTHSIKRMPLMVIGHGRGKLRSPGEHIMVTPPPGDTGNISDLLLSLLRCFDPAAESVGGDVCISYDPFPDIFPGGVVPGA